MENRLGARRSRARSAARRRSHEGRVGDRRIVAAQRKELEREIGELKEEAERIAEEARELAGELAGEQAGDVPI
jgi:hypothetical protein